jgi:polyhydroxyalkanoate synthase
MEVALAGIGGMEQTAKVRRGMWLHATLPRPPIGQTPFEVVHRQDKLVLKYYAPDVDAGLTPVVIVPSLINRASICDLESDRSLVAGLARLGHRVYLVDWGVPGPENAEQGVEHVVLNLLHRSIFRACHHAGAPRAHVVGYCQGGTLSAIYAAMRPERVAGLACLATPIDFAHGGRFADFANASDADASVGPDGLVDIDVMATAFKLLNPMGNWHKYIALEEASKDPRRLARSLARERWLEENVPLAGRFAVEFVDATYKSNRLVEGGWTIGDEVVDLGQVTAPVLVLPCARDFIAPPAACEPLAKLVGSDDVTVELLEAGHIGCVVGGFGPKVFYPLLDRWFRAHAG